MVTNVVAFVAVFVGGLAGAWFAKQGVDRARNWWQSGGRQRWAKAREHWKPELEQTVDELRELASTATRHGRYYDVERWRPELRGWESWPEVTGHIESAGWDYFHTTSEYAADCFVASVSYSYVVNGEWYGGTESAKFTDEQSAEAFASGLRDRDVTVCYRPDKPEISTLPSFR